MSGRRSRAKGARGEREAAKWFTQLTKKNWRRGVGQSRFGSDVADIELEKGSANFWVEVKRGKKTNFRAAMLQAKEASALPAIVLTRDDGGKWILHAEAAGVLALFALMNESAASE